MNNFRIFLLKLLDIMKINNDRLTYFLKIHIAIIDIIHILCKIFFEDIFLYI